MNVRGLLKMIQQVVGMREQSNTVQKASSEERKEERQREGQIQVATDWVLLGEEEFVRFTLGSQSYKQIWAIIFTLKCETERVSFFFNCKHMTLIKIYMKGILLLVG